MTANAEAALALKKEGDAITPPNSNQQFGYYKGMSPKHGQSLVYTTRLIVDLALTIEVKCTHLHCDQSLLSYLDTVLLFLDSIHCFPHLC